MPRRFFKKFTFKRHHVHSRWYLRPFKNFLHHPVYWGIRRRNVVPAFALGLFISFMPFPAHTLLAVSGALLLRLNIPITIAATFFSNPVTMGPIYYFSYRFGLLLLGMDPQPFAIELTLEWLNEGFLAIWQPLLLGCFLLGSLAGLIGYVVLDIFWRASLSDYLQKRRKRRAEKTQRDS